MTIQLQQPGNVGMEASGSATAQTAQAAGQTYEQITEGLKTGETGAETTEMSPAETVAPTKEETEGDELRLMTDEEIGQLPADLQKEAKALRKRFQAAYTKKTQDLAEIRRKAEFSDKFQTDPEYRAQVLRQYQPVQTGQPGGVTGQQPLQVPPQYVQVRRATLPTELQWMAESLAAGDYQRDLAIYQSFIQPMQQDRVKENETRAAENYRAAETDLAEKHPGWDAAEDDMVDLVEFLKSPSLRHDRWGNKLELLYRLVAGEKARNEETQTAIERTAQAAKAKSVTSSGSRGTSSNLEERIRKTKTNNEAWDLIRQNVRV
jgi:hypothetical protein